MALIDPETCSWCTTEVEDTDLHMVRDGARICPRCLNTDEGQRALLPVTHIGIPRSLRIDIEGFFS
jgi:hypothetical protein